MKSKIAVSQALFRNGDIHFNYKTMAMQIKRAISENPEIRLIIFPELSITGYFLSPNLIKLSDKCDGLLFEKMGLLARKYDVWIVYGYVERDGGTLVLHKKYRNFQLKYFTLLGPKR